MEGDTIVRVAVPDDVETLVRFNMELALESESIPLDYNTVRRGVLAMIQDPLKGKYYVAVSGSRVVGQVGLTCEWSDWRNSFIWWLQSVYVVPSARRRGVFRKLYQTIRRDAAMNSVSYLRLYADNDNGSAISVYKKMGMSSHYSVFEDCVEANPRPT